jgi:asparaginyl-tRNA synthetase
VLERSNEKFEFPVHWGIDLQSEHERYLTEKYAKKPVIVMNRYTCHLRAGRAL